MISRIRVNDVNRNQVLNFIKINYPNYVLVEDYELIDRGQSYLSDAAEAKGGLGNNVVVIEMEGDVTIKIKKDDYQKRGRKLVPTFITETDFCDMGFDYNQLLREIKTVSPIEKVQSFQNFEIRGNTVHVREQNLRSGETIFVLR